VAVSDNHSLTEAGILGQQSLTIFIETVILNCSSIDKPLIEVVALREPPLDMVH
jgi:hypothetical protein